jgi:hypothetical protein
VATLHGTGPECPCFLTTSLTRRERCGSVASPENRWGAVQLRTSCLRRSRIVPAMLVTAAVACSPARAATPVPVTERTNGPIAFARAGLEFANADGTNVHTVASAYDTRDPAWSPTGLRLAFTGRDPAGRGQILLIDADGSNRRQLTRDPAGASDPTWSPDGGSIAFTSVRDGNPEIYAIGVDGQNERRLTNDPGIDEQADWSPVGNTIAFESNRAGNFDLWLIDGDGANLRQLTTAPANEWDADWSPDATRIAYATAVPGGQAIFSIASDGSARAQLTSGRSLDQFPVWSPDGALIAFTTNRFPFGIWLMRSTGDVGAAPAHPAITGAFDGDWGALPPPATAPVVLGTSAANITPVAGLVSVTPPEGGQPAPLQGRARIGVGSMVQTTVGTVMLLANPVGGAAAADQTATVSQGGFTLGKPTADGVTLQLPSPRATRCPRRPARAARLPPYPRLKVHSKKGGYRTLTKDAKTISPGTTWLTIESCRGTLTRVTAGFVLVTNLHTGRVVGVTAGHQYLARRAAG